MNPSTYAALLKDLQKLQKAIVAAQVARVRADPALGAALARRHAEAEVGGNLDDFVALSARRSTVRFLLRTVFVRVLEDLGILDVPRIRGDWGFAAFREVAPGLGHRSYLAFVFRDLAHDFPALFAPSPDELPLPPEDECRAVWNLWHHPNSAGDVYAWNGDGFDSRFLGDLYQDLDADIRKRYALLQTPAFVERYILDRTLVPALTAWDPAALRERGETFALLDPTCGSGHFVVGAFRRLADLWIARGCDSWAACERALDGVWGCDINPHAVDIARFRLLLEVVARTGETALDRLAGLRMNLAAMDSLVPWERLNVGQVGLFPGPDRLAVYGTPEQRAANAAFLDRPFHVVVGNPPYITPKDARKREDYRTFWPDSCHRSYALAAPFAERFFDLGSEGAWVGQITANSFMKREFGKPLVERVFPRWDLNAVVDTSGAYIPGHGTPTVILVGRRRPPEGDRVWAILGKRGEPRRPADPEQGLVWRAITVAGQEPNDASPFVTVAWVERAVFGRHPWSLGGGQASDILKQVEQDEMHLRSGAELPIGRAERVGLDEMYISDPAYFRREGFPIACCREALTGDVVRDWTSDPVSRILFPYGLSESERTSIQEKLWNYRSVLAARATFQGVMRDAGLEWFEYMQHTRSAYLRPLTITFAELASHNHFVLDRGGRVFNRSAPVLKLPAGATEDDHLDLLGLLNSSTIEFWMKQVCHNKGAGAHATFRMEDFEQYYVRDASKLSATPLVVRDREARITLSRALDAAARDRAACLPAAILAADDWEPAALRDRLAVARDLYRALTHRMVAIQEELDWLSYTSYGLIEPVETVGPDEVEPLAPGHRPFEIVFAGRDDEADPDERSAWWDRHGHDRVTEVPAAYAPAHRRRLEERVARIEEDPRLALLETPPFKRRWQTPDWDKACREAAESWLLNRLEDLFAPGGTLATPRPYRLEAVVSAWSRDPRVAAVAGVLTGTGLDVDLASVAEPLLRANALPDNPWRLYTDGGLRRLAEWKRVWALQDQEDRDEPLRDPDTGAPLDAIPLPSRWEKGDFRRPEFFAIRGKLNVPRERFVFFADLAPPAFGWNGWRDLDRSLAQVEAFTEAESHPQAPLPPPTAADPRRCGVTLGLWASLEDLRRWGDPGQFAEIHALAQEVCRQPSCPCAVLPEWQRWQHGEMTPGAAPGPALAPAATLDERARLAEALVLFGAHGASLADLLARWPGPPDRLPTVLDDLVASGDVEIVDKGRARRWRGRG